MQRSERTSPCASVHRRVSFVPTYLMLRAVRRGRVSTAMRPPEALRCRLSYRTKPPHYAQELASFHATCMPSMDWVVFYTPQRVSELHSYTACCCCVLSSTSIIVPYPLSMCCSERLLAGVYCCRCHGHRCYVHHCTSSTHDKPDFFFMTVSLGGL